MSEFHEFWRMIAFGRHEEAIGAASDGGIDAEIAAIQ
jgi:hypothetical protein